MAFCGNCGAQIDEGKNFCPKCGTKVGGAPKVTRPKQNRKVLFGAAVVMIAVVAAVVVARGQGSTGQGGGISGPNSFTITSITGRTGEALVWVSSDNSEFDGHLVALGRGAIKSGTLSVALKQMSYDDFRTEEDLLDWTGTGQDWTGSGSFYVAVIFIDDMQMYLYTNGNQSGDEERFDFDRAPKSIEFTKFGREVF